MAARLFNFEVGNHELKREHEDWLRSNVVGLLKRGGSIWIAGLASRTDTDASNMVLSRKRADALILFLRKESPNNFTITVDFAFGERAARFSGSPDGAEDEDWRAVVLSVWNRRDPPPVPVLPAPTREVRSFVKFLAEQKLRGGTAGDPSTTGLLNDTATAMADDLFGGSNGFSEEVKRRVPANYKVTEILTLRDTSGSVELGVAGVQISSCNVSYKWGVRQRPCLLIHGYWRKGAAINDDPEVMRLSDSQADMWLGDPFKALKSLDDWNLQRLSYKDYTQGKL